MGRRLNFLGSQGSKEQRSQAPLSLPEGHQAPTAPGVLTRLCGISTPLNTGVTSDTPPILVPSRSKSPAGRPAPLRDGAPIFNVYRSGSGQLPAPDSFGFRHWPLRTPSPSVTRRVCCPQDCQRHASLAVTLPQENLVLFFFSEVTRHIDDHNRHAYHREDCSLLLLLQRSGQARRRSQTTLFLAGKRSFYSYSVPETSTTTAAVTTGIAGISFFSFFSLNRYLGGHHLHPHHQQQSVPFLLDDHHSYSHFQDEPRLQ